MALRPLVCGTTSAERERLFVLLMRSPDAR
jgi:hypothetical protein